jgi:hypothetical protein
MRALEEGHYSAVAGTVGRLSGAVKTHTSHSGIAGGKNKKLMIRGDDF